MSLPQGFKLHSVAAPARYLPWALSKKGQPRGVAQTKHIIVGMIMHVPTFQAEP
jgi:hypothetical protein